MKNFLVAFLALVLSGCTSDLLPEKEPTPEPVIKTERQTLRIGEQIFHVEVADDAAEREVGLMDRESMEANHGMLFVFETEAPRNFWMKNTLIPLDMVWINEAKEIVDIQAAEPCMVEQCPIYSGRAVAKYVLETNQGVLRATVGDSVEF